MYIKYVFVDPVLFRLSLKNDSGLRSLLLKDSQLRKDFNQGFLPSWVSNYFTGSSSLLGLHKKNIWRNIMF